MLIRFHLGAESVEFHRNWFTGRAELRLRGEIVPLQSPFAPSTHVSVKLKRVWKHRVGDYEAIIEKVRPLLLAALRPHAYRVLVDGNVVAEQLGY